MVKRTLTLLEIMIVILLITLITGAIGYNMKGALEKGKAFRTERSIEQLRDIILLRFAETGDLTAILQNLEGTVANSGLAKDPKALLQDGWGVPLVIKPNRKRDDVTVSSKKLEEYQTKHQQKPALQGDVEDEL